MDEFYQNFASPQEPIEQELQETQPISEKELIDITMLQEELKIYQVFKQHYDEIIAKIRQSHQNQIGIGIIDSYLD